MTIRNEEQKRALLEAGRRLGEVLRALEAAVHPGVSTAELDALAERLIREGGDIPSFKGYTPDGALRPYPTTLCVSVNDEVVHGIPSENPRALVSGDIVSLDLGLTHEGVIVDSAVTVPVGMVAPKTHALLAATQNALAAGILAARAHARVGDISAAIEASMKGTGFSLVPVLGGHGVGDRVHEEPFVPNVGFPGTGEELLPGMVLALEPIANEGKAGVVLGSDGYTYRTRDGSKSAHFEHTILIEENETIVVTRREGESI